MNHRDIAALMHGIAPGIRDMIANGMEVLSKRIDELKVNLPPGEKGEQGEKGLQGEPGQQGEKGDRGDSGESGQKGEKGDVGDAGEPGSAGERGLQGEKGDRGDIGQQGASGEKGESGQRGEDGQQGQKGDKGDPGLSTSAEEIRPMVAEMLSEMSKARPPLGLITDREFSERVSLSIGRRVEITS